MNNSMPYLPYRGWPLQSIVLSILLSVATVSMLVISAINLKVILLSSGLPAFIEDESKADMISLLAPLASISIKLLPMMAFELPQSKRLYQKALFTVTALCILVWVYLTCQTFGTGGEIILGDILKNTGNSNAYTMSQMLCEILMGSCLYSAWQSLHDQRQPAEIDPKIKHLDEEISHYERRVADAAERVSQSTHKVETLKTQRQIFINQQLEALALLNAKNHFIKDFFGDNE